MIRDLPAPSHDARPIGHGRRLWHRLMRRAASAVALLLRWQALARERRQLAELDERMLKDLGLTHAEVEREVRRPFWDAGEIGWRGWR